MKRLHIYRITVFATLVAILPLTLTAADSSTDKSFKRELTESISPLFQDSTAKKKPESKRQEKPEKPDQDVQGERLKEAQRRAIKQVPRSIPKLKPQPVRDNIKRPPIKVPKKGIKLPRL